MRKYENIYIFRRYIYTMYVRIYYMYIFYHYSNILFQLKMLRLQQLQSFHQPRIEGEHLYGKIR